MSSKSGRHPAIAPGSRREVLNVPPIEEMVAEFSRTVSPRGYTVAELAKAMRVSASRAGQVARGKLASGEWVREQAAADGNGNPPYHYRPAEKDG